MAWRVVDKQARRLDFIVTVGLTNALEGGLSNVSVRWCNDSGEYLMGTSWPNYDHRYWAGQLTVNGPSGYLGETNGKTVSVSGVYGLAVGWFQEDVGGWRSTGSTDPATRVDICTQFALDWSDPHLQEDVWYGVWCGSGTEGLAPYYPYRPPGYNGELDGSGTSSGGDGTPDPGWFDGWFTPSAESTSRLEEWVERWKSLGPWGEAEAAGGGMADPGTRVVVPGSLALPNGITMALPGGSEGTSGAIKSLRPLWSAALWVMFGIAFVCWAKGQLSL